MESMRAGVLGVALASWAVVAVAEVGVDHSAAARARAQASPLHQSARAAGGKLQQRVEARPQTLALGLRALSERSSDVVLVHVLGNHCELSPDGVAPLTRYQALVLRSWKGAAVGETIEISLPVGLVSFEDGTKASRSARGFRALKNDMRYVLFLREADASERGQTPGRRLSGGDGLQGAFGLYNERVYPAYHLDGMNKKDKYRGLPVAKFVRELDGVGRPGRR